MKRRRLLIALGIVLFLVFVLPFLIPIPSAGADPAALAQQIEAGQPIQDADPQLVAALSNPDGRYIEVNGVQTYVIDMGPADGEPIIFLHGFGGSTFSWRENLAPIAEQGFRVIAFDRPPFGLSEKPFDLDYSHSAQADFTAALMDELSIESASLVGHSAGGNVVAYFALQYPERVDNLVIVSGSVIVDGGPPPFIGTLVGFPPVNRWLQIGLRTFLTPERLTGSLATAYVNPDVMRGDVQRGYQLPLRTQNWDTGLIALVRDSGNNIIDAESLPEIVAPTLLIWGAEDTWVPLDNGQELARSLPNSILQTYERVGHMPMEEAASNFNLDVVVFLQTGTLAEPQG